MTKIKPWNPDAETDEPCRLCVEETGHAYHVCAAFIVRGETPPITGAFTGPQSDIIQKHYDLYDPNGARQENAALDAEISEDE